jgi:hypothetical protein
VKSLIRLAIIGAIVFLAARTFLLNSPTENQASAEKPKATEPAAPKPSTPAPTAAAVPAPAPTPATPAPASAPVSTPTRTIILTSDLAAYDSQTSTQQIGYFMRDSMIGIMGSVNSQGMYPVEFRDPSGKVTSASCKKEDIDPYLGITPAPAASTGSSTALAPYQMKNVTGSARASNRPAPRPRASG